MIFEGLTPYSFRIDLPNNEESTAEILKFFEKFNVVKYYGNPELGSETQKPHYQMIIWCKKEFTQKEMNERRNYWRGKVKTKKGGGCSFTKCKKEKNLFGYCRKEEKNDILTNVSKEIIKSIPVKQTKNALKVANAEKLQKIIGGISQKLNKFEYSEALSQAYFRVYNRPNISQRYYTTWLYKAGYYDDRDILNIARVNLNLGKEYIWSENLNYSEEQKNYII